MRNEFSLWAGKIFCKEFDMNKKMMTVMAVAVAAFAALGGVRFKTGVLRRAGGRGVAYAESDGASLD
jgi:hypothetical protein